MRGQKSVGSTANLARVAVLYTRAADPRPGASSLVRVAENLAGNAEAILKSLRLDGCTVRGFDFGDDPVDISRALRQFQPDVVYNLAESPQACYEKEPHAAALLELLRLPYTGNGPVPLILSKDKARSKVLLRGNGIPTPAFCVCASIPKNVPALQFPLVVKPLRQDGSIGITEQSVVGNGRELRSAVAYVLESQRQEALVEEFVSGRELHVSVLGNGSAFDPFRILPPSEYIYHSDRWRVCTFEAKWDENHPSYAAVEAVYPAKVSRRLRGELERLTLACARIFELSGYARIDFRLDSAGVPQVLDINPNPDLAPGMGIARAAETDGMSYGGLVRELMRLALAKGPR